MRLANGITLLSVYLSVYPPQIFDAYEITVLSVYFSPLIFIRRFVTSPCCLYASSFFRFVCNPCHNQRKIAD
jgi:hypothetical protein